MARTLVKFEPGQVWEWETRFFALMRKDEDESLHRTIYYENQERWWALNLETGAFNIIIIHTSIFTSGNRWVRHS